MRMGNTSMCFKGKVQNLVRFFSKRFKCLSSRDQWTKPIYFAVVLDSFLREHFESLVKHLNNFWRSTVEGKYGIRRSKHIDIVSACFDFYGSGKFKQISAWMKKLQINYHHLWIYIVSELLKAISKFTTFEFQVFQVFY